VSTNSHIGTITAEGHIRANYCHSDGYVQHHAPILLEHYNTQERVDELLALGALSRLSREVGEKHNFNCPTRGWCVAYKRDRGDELFGGTVWEDHVEFFAPDLAHIPYVYLFIGGKWFFFSRLRCSTKAEPLEMAYKRFKGAL